MSFNTPIIDSNPLKTLNRYPVSMIFAARNPTTADLGGNVIGVEWQNTVTKDFYKLLSIANGVAVWDRFASSTAGEIIQITPDGGTPVTPDANGNLNLNGTSAQGLSFSGSTNTITGTIADWTTTQKGVGVLATNAEAIAGAVSTKAIVPSSLNAKLGTQTQHGVILGGGSTAALGVTAVGTTGQVLIGSTGADPAFGALGVNSGLTAHGVLVGEGNSAIAALAVGTTGQLLTGQTGADPVFASTSNGDFSFTQPSTSSNTVRTLTVSNSDTANTGSNAQFVATVGGTSSGDPMSVWSITGGQTWSAGADRSDSGIWKLSNGSALGTNDTFKMTSAGVNSMPLQPLVLATPPGAANVTGAGTNYLIPCNTAPINQGSYFNTTTNLFTVPVTGNYLIGLRVVMTNISALMTSSSYGYYVNGGGGGQFQLNFAAIRDAGNQAEGLFWGIFPFTAGDTIQPNINISSGAADTAGISNGTAFWVMKVA